MSRELTAKNDAEDVKKIQRYDAYYIVTMFGYREDPVVAFN